MSENIKERYSDGIGKIHFCGGMIRWDMFSFEPANADDQKPEPKVIERIVMSPNAFLASYDAMCSMIEKLKAAGILASVKDQPEANATVEADNTKKTDK